MKAICINGFKERPVVLEIPVPEIAPHQVLVKVQAAALNPLDVHLISGWAAQFFPPIRFPYGVGTDCAGVVERVGEDVTNVQLGDAVIVWAHPVAGGGLSEFVAVPGHACIPLPKSLSAFEGSAIPTAASTAWHALFAVGQLKKDETVLIHAAAGGVGNFAVQFARKAGARVVTTASGEGVNLARSLGAHEVVDYRKQDFTEVFKNVDLVIDLVGGETQARSYLVLKRGGRLVSPTTPPDEELAKHYGVLASMFYVAPYASHLSDVVQAIDRDQIRVVIDRTLPLSAFSDALDYQKSGRARGKIVLDHALPL